MGNTRLSARSRRPTPLSVLMVAVPTLLIFLMIFVFAVLYVRVLGVNRE